LYAMTFSSWWPAFCAARLNRFVSLSQFVKRLALNLARRC
jgi:hypothetical protein